MIGVVDAEPCTLPLILFSLRFALLCFALLGQSVIDGGANI